MNTKTITAGLALVMAIVDFARGYEFEGFRWPGEYPQVTYYVSNNLQGHVPWSSSAGTFQDTINAIQSAANEWNTAGNSNFEFVYGGTTNVTSVADDGINAIIYSATQCPYGGGCPAAIRYHTEGSVFKGFDIILYKRRAGDNRTMYWASDEHPLVYEMDVWSTVLHEFGHALGLDHGQGGAVMGSCVGPGGTLRILASDDIAGIQALYGVAPNNAEPCGLDSECNDDDFCTDDLCVDGLCDNLAYDCSDGDACTDDFCDDGWCVSTPRSCDDQNLCTEDVCSAVLGCITLPISCDDDDACTIDNCDPSVGCTHVPRTCMDTNFCTTDSCDPDLGCVFTPNPGCFACKAKDEPCFIGAQCCSGQCMQGKCK